MTTSKSLFGRKQVIVHKGFFFVIVSLVFGVIAIYCFQTYLDFRESIKFGAALLAAALTITSILITAENIRRSTEERRAASASAFIARYNDPKFFEQLLISWRIVYRDILVMKPEEVADYINQGWSPQGVTSPEEQSVDQLKKKYNRRFVAVQMFNFFEEIAIAIEDDQAEEKILFNYFETVIPVFYTAAEPWIRNQQKASSSQVYIAVEQLVTRWRSRLIA